MKKMTKREKLLIYILACFLIGFFGIYFVVWPSIQSYLVVNDQVAEAQFTKESMAMAIEAIPSTRQEKASAKANLTSIKAVFPQKLPNEGLDMLLTQLCLDYSLAPKVLSIASNDIADVLAFVPYTSDEQATAEVETEETTSDTSTATDETMTSTSTATDETMTSTSTGKATDTTSTTNTETTETTETTDTTDTTESTDAVVNTEGVQTLIGVVNMELTGTQANFYRLLDTVAARPDMIITAFEIKPETTTTSGTSSTSSSLSSANGGVPKLDSGKVAINVTFEVYMME